MWFNECLFSLYLLEFKLTFHNSLAIDMAWQCFYSYAKHLKMKIEKFPLFEINWRDISNKMKQKQQKRRRKRRIWWKVFNSTTTTTVWYETSCNWESCIYCTKSISISPTELIRVSTACHTHTHTSTFVYTAYLSVFKCQLSLFLL